MLFNFSEERCQPLTPLPPGLSLRYPLLSKNCTNMSFPDIQTVVSKKSRHFGSYPSGGTTRSRLPRIHFPITSPATIKMGKETKTD